MFTMLLINQHQKYRFYVWCPQKGPSQSTMINRKLPEILSEGPSCLSHPRLGVGNPASRRFPNFPSPHLLSCSQMWKLSKWSSHPLWHTVLSDDSFRDHQPEYPGLISLLHIGNGHIVDCVCVSFLT